MNIFERFWYNTVLRNTVLIVLGVIALAYFVFVIMCVDVYFPGTKINGKDYSFKSPYYVDNEIYESGSDYILELKFRNGSEYIKGTDINLNYDYLRNLQNIKENQNPFLFLKGFGSAENIIAKEITYSEDMLDFTLQNLDELDPENMKEPQNPVIYLDENDEVKARIDDYGTVIEDVSGLKKVIKQAIMDETKTIDVEELGFYKEPEYSLDCDAVQKCIEDCSEIAGLNISYIYGDTEIQYTHQELFNTIKINKNYLITVSKEKVGTMVENFSKAHDTYGTTRTFKTHSGKKITTESKTYGWQIDTEVETDNMFNDIINRSNVSRTPEFTYSAYTYDISYDADGNIDDIDDIGDFYAEVDLTNQHMYLIEDGKVILESDVVTGCTNLGRGTPTGLYYIAYRQSPAVLKGDDYETDVTFWMPFNGGIGFHDATWRGSFGGSIYVYSGSHGCVNMPYYSARDLFYLVDEGMPVIVYE